jgi:quinol monooxygenase YgiN
MSKITKKVIFVAKDDSIEELKKLLEMMVVPSRNEVGCELYNIYQLEAKPNTFVVVETWENDEALKGHQNSAHYKEYKANFEPYTAEKFSDEMSLIVD